MITPTTLYRPSNNKYLGILIHNASATDMIFEHISPASQEILTPYSPPQPQGTDNNPGTSGTCFSGDQLRSLPT